MSQSAEIDKSLRKSYEETHIEWEITDFFSIKYKDKFCASPRFSFADVSLEMHLYLQSSICPGIIVVYLCNNVSDEYSVEYNLGLKKLDGSSEELLTGIVHGQDRTNMRNPFIKLSEVLQRKCELSRSDTLTITGTLKRGTPLSIQTNVLDEPKPKKLIISELETLSENFKDLFLNKESCDITLRVGSNEYKAHKATLIARSSVFAAMFLHEMTEKQTGIINIPDCDPDSFEVFLEYLYCGKIEELSFSIALHLYETSDKYDVQELKTRCAEFLMENLTPKNVCDVVIMADKYDDSEMLSAAQDFFTENLNDIFLTSEWECFLGKNHCLANKLLKGMSKMKVAK